MKRWLIILTGVTLFVLGIALCGGWWLLATSQGQRWLLAELSRRTTMTVYVEQVDGRLLDHLKLTGVTARWQGGEARLASVALSWRPLALLHGHLAIDTLAVAGGVVALAPATEPPERGEPPGWPQAEGWPRWLSASIASLQLEELALRGGTGEPQRIDRLATRLNWRRGTLSLTELEATADDYTLRGTVRAGFRHPQLQLALLIDLPTPIVDAGRLVLDADLAPAKGALFAGPVALRGVRGTDPVWQLEGRLAAATDSVTLDNFVLTQSGRHGTVSGTATVTLAGEQPRWTVQAELADLDLTSELGRKTSLSGRLAASGQGLAGQGEFDMANRGEGWEALRLAGPFAADASSLELPRLTGSWLHGTLAGALRLTWEDGLHLEGSLAGRALDPAVLAADWPGELNVDLDGKLQRVAGQPLRGTLRCRLLDSTLHGNPLTGRVEATLTGDDLRLDDLELHGTGFSLQGHGRLAERLDWHVTVISLSNLLPDARGGLIVRGWLGRRAGAWVGAADGRGTGLGYDRLEIGTLGFEARLARDGTASARLDAASLAYDAWHLLEATLRLDGRLDEHTLGLTVSWAGGEMGAAATGGWRNGIWSGTLERLWGEDAAAGPWRLLQPAPLEVGPQRLRLAQLRLGGRGGESLRLDVSFAEEPWDRQGAVHWQDLDLRRFDRWIPNTPLTGHSNGALRLRQAPDGGLDLAGSLSATGSVRLGNRTMTLLHATGQLQWDAAGLRAQLDVALDGESRFAARFDSPQPGRLALPQQGSLAGEWTGFDLALLRPWLPDGLILDGAWQGSARGEWHADGRLALTGATAISGGMLRWKSSEGEVAAALRTARLDWQWGDNSLHGGLAIDLADYGSVQGSFRLPLPARLPAALNPAGPLRLDLTGEVGERGLLSTIFPGLVVASRGHLEVRAQARGTWQDPELSGKLQLSDAGAYFPAAGIELREVELTGELADDELRLTSFRARSGPGHVEGSGLLRLSHWRPISYQGNLKGKRFEAVSFPELNLLVDPDLTVSGDRERLKLRGTLRIPELIARDRQQQGVIRESPDVVLAGSATAEQKAFPLALDARVRVVLGKRVLVKVAGVDARLEGEVELQTTSLEAVTATGEIQVAQGIYSIYGIQLKIERGRLLYTGGAVGQPTLDILALRRIGEIKAGVQVGGTPRVPQVKLYGDPSMPDGDILSYIVFGHPLGTGTGELSLLGAAAGALLSHGQSVMLQDRIKQQLGIDVITVEEGEDLGGSMISVGKYLSPKLYLRFGQALFANASEARLRYSITPHWELETKTTGEKSGVDLYYKIEFD